MWGSFGCFSTNLRCIPSTDSSETMGAFPEVLNLQSVVSQISAASSVTSGQASPFNCDGRDDPPHQNHVKWAIPPLQYHIVYVHFEKCFSFFHFGLHLTLKEGHSKNFLCNVLQTILESRMKFVTS